LCNDVGIDTPARLLRLLTLMSSRGTWRGNELASRLEVTERSVRRDITRLRDLGYPIESVTGKYGGYSLGAGGRLPPLLLSDDEAVSIAVALHDVSRRSSEMVAEGAISALTKLGQVMPATLRERVAALTEVVVGVSSRADRDRDTGSVETLMGLAIACARSERTRFDYRTGDGTESMRHTEPFRLVNVSQRWYLVAFDIDRDDWRTFRVDRVDRVRVTGARFQRTDAPDAATFVAEGLAVHSYAQRSLVRVHAPPNEAAWEIPATVGVIRPDPDDETCSIVEIGGDDDWIARFLASLELPYEVLEPESLRDELRRLGRRLVEQNRRKRSTA
jgi:predicted DNA-binding transcriptional regulator YafY